MPGEVTTPKDSELSTQERFDVVVAQVYANSKTIENFTDTFNTIFPDPENYLWNLKYKLDPEYIYEHHLISCTGAALSFESFVRERFGTELKVVFAMDNLTSKGHTIVLVLPQTEVPSDADLKTWLSERLQSGDTDKIWAYTYYKKSSFTSFNLSRIATYPILFDSVSEYVAGRRKAFALAQSMDT